MCEVWCGIKSDTWKRCCLCNFTILWAPLLKLISPPAFTWKFWSFRGRQPRACMPAQNFASVDALHLSLFPLWSQIMRTARTLGALWGHGAIVCFLPVGSTIDSDTNAQGKCRPCLPGLIKNSLTSRCLKVCARSVNTGRALKRGNHFSATQFTMRANRLYLYFHLRWVLLLRGINSWAALPQLMHEFRWNYLIVPENSLKCHWNNLIGRVSRDETRSRSLLINR